MSNKKNRFNIEEEESQQGIQASAEEGVEDTGGDDDTSPEAFERDKGRLVDFLQYPRDKRKMTEFLQETYKAYEQESIDRTINRVIHEHESEMRGATPFYKPGHTGP